MAKQNHYELLGVTPDAGFDSIRQAYRELARRHHPDRTNGDPAHRERFETITAAYEVLIDPARRMEYDFAHFNQGAFSAYGSADRARAVGDAQAMQPLRRTNSPTPADNGMFAGNLGLRKTLMILILCIAAYVLLQAFWTIIEKEDATAEADSSSVVRPATQPSQSVEVDVSTQNEIDPGR